MGTRRRSARLGEAIPAALPTPIATKRLATARSQGGIRASLRASSAQRLVRRASSGHISVPLGHSLPNLLAVHAWRITNSSQRCRGPLSRARSPGHAPEDCKVCGRAPAQKRCPQAALQAGSSMCLLGEFTPIRAVGAVLGKPLGLQAKSKQRNYKQCESPCSHPQWFSQASAGAARSARTRRSEVQAPCPAMLCSCTHVAYNSRGVVTK